MPIHVSKHATVMTGEGITRFRLLTLISGLRLEINCPGMRLTRGVSCYALAKREFGFRGNRAKVLAQLEAYASVQHMGVKVTHEESDDDGQPDSDVLGRG